MKSTKIFLGILLSFSTNVFAGNNSALPYLKINVGAKSDALGGAFTALSDDVTGIYWNPATTVFGFEKQAQVSYQHLTFDRKHNFLGYSQRFPVKNFALGVMLINSGTTGIKSYDSNNQPKGKISSSDNALFFSGSYGFNQFFSLGGNLKFLYNSIDNQSDTGFGFDLASYYRPLKEVKFGLVVHDVYTKAGSSIGRVPWNVKFGTAYEYFPKGLTGTADVSKIEGDSKVAYSLGSQWKFYDEGTNIEIAFRSGLNTISFENFGFSAGIGFKKDRFGFEYAFVSNSENIFGQTHVVSTSFTFGEAFKYVGRSDQADDVNYELQEIRRQRILEEQKLEELMKDLNKK